MLSTIIVFKSNNHLNKTRKLDKELKAILKQHLGDIGYFKILVHYKEFNLIKQMQEKMLRYQEKTILAKINMPHNNKVISALSVITYISKNEIKFVITRKYFSNIPI